MKSLRLASVALVAAGAVAVLLYQLLPGLGSRAPTYDWQCSQCQHQFQHPVRDAAADLPVIDCPKGHARSAERIMHYQCRKCWKKYDLRGSKATLANMVCPACGGRAARDLDNPIPGDDEPVEGGEPYPGK